MIIFLALVIVGIVLLKKTNTSIVEIDQTAYGKERKWSEEFICKEATEIKTRNVSATGGEYEYEMGEDYYYGRNGKTKDLDKAMIYYLEASKKGNLEAIFSVGYLNYHQAYNHDAQKTFNYLSYAAYGGHVAAQRYVGYCYWYGEGTEKNIRKALIWFYKAAQNGDVEAMHKCALLFDEKEQNEDAVRYYAKAAEKGNVSALYGLALHYYYGQGVGEDIFYAEKCLKKFQEAISRGTVEDIPQIIKDEAINLKKKIQSEKIQISTNREEKSYRASFQITGDYRALNYNGYCIHQNTTVCRNCARRGINNGDWGEGAYCRREI